ncbi:MAG: S4 domain-containing protein [Candidatus Competibacter sp.]|nr:S4 domain-containing protein [Candidatus Competibacter sp.]
MAESDEDRRSADAVEKRVRLDKWLWAARFFKTRTLAAEAVAGGRVHVGGQRVKPARVVRPGEILRIRRDLDEYTVVVRALSDRRQSAREAVLLYEETAESRQRREELGEQRHLQRLSSPASAGRPTKQDRRRIVRFTRRDQ